MPTLVDSLHAVTEVETSGKARVKVGPVVITHMEKTDFFRQGDIYIQRVNSIPRVRLVETKEPQLALGNTRGSRHCIATQDLGHVKIYREKVTSSLLQGPYLEASTLFTVTHPDHNHVTLPAGKYRVVYQRQLSALKVPVKD